MGLGVTLPRPHPRPCQVCMRLQVIPHFTRLYIITTNERGKATDGESISIRAHKTAPDPAGFHRGFALVDSVAVEPWSRDERLESKGPNGGPIRTRPHRQWARQASSE